MKEPRSADLSEEYRNMLYQLADKVQLSEVIGSDFRLTYALIPDELKAQFLIKITSFKLSELGDTLEALAVLSGAND